MRHIPLGNTDLRVSPLALGTWTFAHGPVPGGFGRVITPADADCLVGACLDAGINLFDTADVYQNGEAETILGATLAARNVRRESVVICTKAGFPVFGVPRSGGLSARYLIQSCEASLRRLKTDYVDLFLLHIVDPQTPVEETAEALEQLRAAGKIRYAGYSNFWAWQAQKLRAAQEKRGYAPLCAAQLFYSLAGRDIEGEHTDFLRDANIALMAWSPLAGGLLSGKYAVNGSQAYAPPGQMISTEDASGRHATFASNLQISPNVAAHAVEAVRDVANEGGISPATVAVAWLLHQPHVATVVIGVSRVAQLADNLAAITLTLPPGAQERLNAATKPAPRYPGWMHPASGDTNHKPTKETAP